jgi:hypothetical protein
MARVSTDTRAGIDGIARQAGACRVDRIVASEGVDDVGTRTERNDVVMCADVRGIDAAAGGRRNRRDRAGGADGIEILEVAVASRLARDVVQQEC